jgi:hypothetical protein
MEQRMPVTRLQLRGKAVACDVTGGVEGAEAVAEQR